MLLIRKSTFTLKVKVHYINDQFTRYKLSVNARAGCGPKSVAHQYIYGTLLFKHHEAFPFIINFGLLFYFSSIWQQLRFLSQWRYLMSFCLCWYMTSCSVSCLSQRELYRLMQLFEISFLHR